MTKQQQNNDNDYDDEDSDKQQYSCSKKRYWSSVYSDFGMFLLINLEDIRS